MAGKEGLRDEVIQMMETFKVFEAYTQAMKTFEDFGAEVEQVALCVRSVRPYLQGAEGAATRDAFEYWAGAFEQTRAATSRATIKALARKFVVSTDPRSASPFNIVQGLMKATIHLMWKELYAFDEGVPPAAVQGPLPPAQASRLETLGVASMQRLYREIAAESGETVEAMMQRVCGNP